MNFETVIGLEIHTQLKTKSKIFSASSTAYGASPNSQANVVDLGMPGVLPVLNKEVVNMAIKLGLSIGAKISRNSVFARKNYFYPDLPKGYQISQLDLPIVYDGHLDIEVDDTIKRIGITRAHLEEDAGKSLHEDFHGCTGIDLNRAGTPLLEIVSEPDLRSARQAHAYMKALYALVTYLDICDGNMQEGSFRCDANVSIRPIGETKLGTRTELKNINSFKFVEKAINYEIERQIAVLESGGHVVQETRLYDANKHETRPMRSKEEANDYRYFPDPDLLPIIISDDMIEHIKINLPELPTQKLERFQKDYQLSKDEAALLLSDKNLANYFEAIIKDANCKAKLALNWLTVELQGALNKANLEFSNCPISVEHFSGLMQRIEDNTISSKMAKVVFQDMFEGLGDANTIIEKRGLKQMTDSNALEAVIDDIIEKNPEQVQQFRAGKEKVFGFFVGQVMKATKGQANPKQVNDLLRGKLQT